MPGNAGRQAPRRRDPDVRGAAPGDHTPPRVPSVRLDGFLPPYSKFNVTRFRCDTELTKPNEASARGAPAARHPRQPFGSSRFTGLCRRMLLPNTLLRTKVN